MKKTVKTVLILLLAGVLLCALVPAVSVLADDTPTVLTTGNQKGTNYTFYSDGTLVLSRSGEIYNTFVNCNVIIGTGVQVKHIIVQEGVTGLGDHTFTNAQYLQSISLPASLTYVSHLSLQNCNALETITVSEDNPVFRVENNCLIEKATGIVIKGTNTSVIPADGSITAIATHAFYNRDGLTELTVPESVTSIGVQTFSQCDQLDTIHFPDTPVKVGQQAFSGTAWINSQPEGLLYLGKTVIGYKGSLSGVTSVEFRADTVGITEIAFCSASSLTSLELPESLQYIGPRAFQYCSGLTEISLPDSVAVVEDNAFDSCTQLQSISLGSGLRSFAGSALANCPALDSITVSENNPRFSGVSDCLIQTDPGILVAGCKNSVIPADGSVTRIADKAFYYCPGLTHVSVPDSVTQMGSAVFMGCTGLETAVIGSGLTGSLGYQAFYGCTSLVSVTVNSDLTFLDQQIFRGCTSLTSFHIPETVTSIGAESFYECAALQQVNIPAGVTVIGREAFRECASLTAAAIPDSVTTLGTMSFYHCASLASLTIGSGVTSIYRYTFNGCEALTSVVLPDSVIAVADEVFGGCTSLTSISIGRKAANLSASMLRDCVSLSEITVSPLNIKYSAVDNCLIKTADKLLLIGCKNSVIPADGSVTAIGNAAFQNCTGLTSITLPEGLVSIGSSAFSGCTGLTEISLPDSLTSVGNYVFYNCTALSELSLGGGLTNIPSYAFSYSALTSLTLPDNIETVTSTAFSFCSSLASLYVGSGLSRIEYDAFYKCALQSIQASKENPYYYAAEDCLVEKENARVVITCNKQTVTVPEGVRVIGKITAYYQLNLIETLILPRSLERFESNAVQTYDAPLRSVYFNGTAEEWDAVENKPDFGSGVKVYPNGGACGENVNWSYADGVLTLYGEGPMQNYTGSSAPRWMVYKDMVHTLIAQEGVTYLGAYAFKDMADLAEASLPSTLTGIGANAFRGTGLTEIALPAGLTEIGSSAFHSCQSLTSVTIPENTVRIGGNAFNSCLSLVSASVPGSVTDFGPYVFSSCAALTDVTLGEGLQMIPDGMFRNCSALSEINIPAGVTVIGYEAFSGCAQLQEICLPDTVTGIGNAAFRYCTGITSVTVPANVTVLNQGLFTGCTSLADVTLPAGLTEIGAYAFKDCTALPEIDIPESVANIGGFAFQNCRSLVCVTIPQAVTAVYSQTFSGCTSLASVTVPDSVTEICSNAFHNCTSLASFRFPASLTTVGYAAFEYCSGLTEIALPEGVTYLDAYAFANCTGLESAGIPVSLTSVGSAAFYGCRSMKYVFYAGTPEQWQQINFRYSNFPLTEAFIHYESTGHTPGEAVYENELLANCTEPGSRDEVVYCTFCDYEFSRTQVTVPAPGHDFFDIPALAPTCTEDGHTAYRMCARCAIWDPMPETLPALGHSYGDPVRENEVPATCTVMGEYDRVIYCTDCGAEIVREHVFEPALGHTFESEITLAPTCTEPGVRTYTCVRCPESYTEAEPALGHGTLDYDVSGAPSTCIVRGYSMTVCLACGEITDYEELPLDPTNHNWGEWVLVTPATYLTEGLEQRTCAWCGETETGAIPTLVPKETISDSETGIELQLQEGVLPENTVFEVDEEFDGTYFMLLNRDLGHIDSTLYNITPVADGEKVQPDGYVLVRLPIPAGYNPDTLSIYYISTETGTTERMDCYIEDGYICFQTTHFSVYAIVDFTSGTSAQTEPPTQPQTENGNSGSFFARIADWFRNIISLFKNLFKR